MVTACAILLGGLLTRYAAINDRMRLLARERLDLIREGTTDTYTTERLGEIDRQLPELAGRHRMEHDALLRVYGAVLIFIAVMFMIAIAAVANASWASTLILVLFLLGTAVMAWGVLITTLEVQRSLHAVEFEVQRVAELGQKMEKEKGEVSR